MSKYYISVTFCPVSISEMCSRRTGDSIGWQFSGGDHDVTEVECGVMDVTQFPVRMLSRTEEFQRRLEPTQAGQVTAGKHVDEGSVSIYQTLAC